MIGIGNSGGDIAVELSRVTKQVGLAELHTKNPDICVWIVLHSRYLMQNHFFKINYFYTFSCNILYSSIHSTSTGG